MFLTLNSRKTLLLAFHLCCPSSPFMCLSQELLLDYIIPTSLHFPDNSLTICQEAEDPWVSCQSGYSSMSQDPIRVTDSSNLLVGRTLRPFDFASTSPATRKRILKPLSAGWRFGASGWGWAGGGVCPSWPYLHAPPHKLPGLSFVCLSVPTIDFPPSKCQCFASLTFDSLQ